MLGLVDEVLQELGLVEAQTRLHYYINISSGNAHSISAYVNPEVFFQVKVSEFVDLRRESEAYAHGRTQYAELVPRPLGYRTRGGWCIMVGEGIHHTPFRFEQASHRRHRQTSILDGLYRYFEICGQQKPLPDQPEANASFLQGMQDHFAATPYASIALHWLGVGRALGLHALAPMAQHGDFAENNLACSGDRLVIFDWEDYGVYHMAGLDICSFCFSVAPHASTLRGLMQPGSAGKHPLHEFVQRACTASGLDPDFFRRLIPLYVLMLLYSRRNYGQALQDRMAAILPELTQ